MVARGILQPDLIQWLPKSILTVTVSPAFAAKWLLPRTIAPLSDDPIVMLPAVAA